ncbi:hypothetical protein BpHYR1_027276 [Brachionus plicatilis]|uniref:Uncharacterized protein n=1 Tax=Brachionus plicatilis TaxID=10195 RepID=A0A3M7RB41_BRAPC|nr:hypothetical protein BpHYR1_027276 [Brachionus plicatilis]
MTTPSPKTKICANQQNDTVKKWRGNPLLIDSSNYFELTHCGNTNFNCMCHIRINLYNFIPEKP